MRGRWDAAGVAGQCRLSLPAQLHARRELPLRLARLLRADDRCRQFSIDCVIPTIVERGRFRVGWRWKRKRGRSIVP